MSKDRGHVKAYLGKNVLILALFQRFLLNFKTTEECQEPSEKPHVPIT